MSEPNTEVVTQEMHTLREELRDLKSYQFRLVSIAALITGFLLSLTRVRLDANLSIIPSQSLYLLPLIIIVPSWCIFFDKTKTITRIVGYCRILEAILNGDAEASCRPVGWERSLGKFRKTSGAFIKRLKKEDMSRHPLGHRLRFGVWHFIQTISLVESQRYWTLAYATFLTLSAVCFWVPIKLRYPISLHSVLSALHVASWTSDSFLLIVAAGLTSYIAVFNAVVLARLMRGQHSYDFMERVWKRVLSSRSVGED